MGTKNDPGPFRCYENADPNVQVFTLVGDDEDAPAGVLAWADARAKRIADGTSPNTPRNWERVAEARQIACRMILDRIEHEQRKMIPKLLETIVPEFDEASAAQKIFRGSFRAGAEAATLTRAPSPGVSSVAPTRASEGQCQARRQTDEMWCRKCGLRWGVDDCEPPPCPEGLAR